MITKPRVVALRYFTPSRVICGFNEKRLTNEIILPCTSFMQVRMS